jgi:hypothetical protein
MTARGIYTRDGELFGYLIGKSVFDLEDTQTGYLREGVIYSKGGREQWVVRGDGLYSLKGESIGYIGEGFQER